MPVLGLFSKDILFLVISYYILASFAFLFEQNPAGCLPYKDMSSVILDFRQPMKYLIL
ncbi:MAG: hypothetical protein H6Q52_1680 [Deltaproteobacteria bacterium]|nr:hypothetical protein [Deltaproteobacteria bacterium]